MKVSQIVFSPTGGTGKVAEVIAQAWVFTAISISNKKSLFSKKRK